MLPGLPIEQLEPSHVTQAHAPLSLGQEPGNKAGKEHVPLPPLYVGIYRLVMSMTVHIHIIISEYIVH